MWKWRSSHLKPNIACFLSYAESRPNVMTIMMTGHECERGTVCGTSTGGGKEGEDQSTLYVFYLYVYIYMPYLCLYEDSIRKPHQIMFKKGGRLKRG
jgi:hypothetical protein